MGRSQGISRIIFLYLCLVGVLTACGGNGSGSDDLMTSISPSPTPSTPYEERIHHQLGTAENPFIMLIKPVDWIDRQIPVMLETLGFEAVTAETNLRDGDTLRDDLADLQIAIETTFGVRLLTYELEAVQTIDDLSHFITQRVIAEATRALFDSTSLYIEIQLIENYGQAFNQLCRIDDGLVRMAWLDGLSYLAASEQTCGDGEMMLLHGEERDLFSDVTFDLSVLDAPATATPNADDEPSAESIVESPFNPPALQLQNLVSGHTGTLVLNGSLGATNPNVLETRTFCQLDDEADFYSVFLPMLILEQENVTPAEIRQMSDIEGMLQAVASGDCAGAMVSTRDLNRYSDEEWFDDIRISRTSVPFPYGVLTYPLEVEIGVRLSLNSYLMLSSRDAQEGWYLRLLLGYDTITELYPDVHERLQLFVRNLGYDFSQLGN